MKKFTAILLALSLLATTLSACSKQNSDSQVDKSGSSNSALGSEKPVEVRFSWWGSEARHEATLAAIETYEAKNTGVKIIPEYAGYDGYQDKLMAQVAGGNAPDIFTCVTEWYPALNDAKGMLEITGKFDMSGHSDAIIQACSYDDKVYGVNVSLNGYGLIYNKTLADKLSIKMPQGDYTWDDLTAIWAEVYEKSNGEVYGGMDTRFTGWIMEAYGYTALQKAWPYMYDNTGLTITAEDVTAFLEYFGSLPEGSMLPPDESFNVDVQTAAPVSQGLTLTELDSTGSFALIQSQTQDELALLPLPVGPKGESSNTARPGLILSIYSGTKVADEAVKFLDWFTNSAEAAKILKTTRGVLPTAIQREAVLEQDGFLDRNDMVVIDCIDKIYAGDTLVFLPGPLGVDEARITVFKNICHEAAFGKLTSKEAGVKFMKDAKNALDH